MDNKTIKDMILEDRGKFYSCSRETFFRKGTSFKQRDSLDGKNTLYVTRLFDHHFITTGKELIEKLKNSSNDGQKELSTDLLKEILPDFSIKESYPHFLYHKTEIVSPALPEEYEIRKADPSIHPPLQEFLDGCTEEDIEDALIELDDPDEEIRLVYHRNKPVGYAGYRRWGVNMGDVGILIQKKHRKKGLGSAAVAAATAACLANKCLPFYRTSSENVGSQTIARNLGYQWEWVTAQCTCKL
jgi:RimJ/RimL family protein N-acetyltransferase